MRIAVCDDERHYSEVMQRFIEQWAAVQEQVVSLNVYDSAEAFLKDFNRGEKYDLAFLDIQMGGMSGVELAKRIRQTDMNMLIVFATNYRDHVFEGYEVDGFRHLMKPVKERKLLETLDTAVEMYKKRSTGFFTIQTETATFRIAKADIVYFATHNHYIQVHTFEETHKYRGKMPDLEREFAQPSFTKCNRGILVNVQHVLSIHKDYVSMANKENLTVSRTYWEELNRCYLAVHVEPEIVSARRALRKVEDN